NSLSKVSDINFQKEYLNRKINEGFIGKLKHSFYSDLFGIIKIIINQWGVDLLISGKTKAQSMIINIEDVFEKYLLKSLMLQNVSENNLVILDGNKKGENGGAKPLFSKNDDEFLSKEIVIATPDIVIRSMSEPKKQVVVDVKYKLVDKICDRADLNQIVTYMSSYEASAGVLLIPFHKDTKNKILCLGSISGYNVYQYSFDLNAENLLKEEQELLKFFTKLCA
ncbi:hypothetical protein J0S50_003717, partial [Salmonella enterica subsp. enterica serovar Newport]|nr:hypothetical protein [Salmonella enterica]EHF1793010.1 hypothetical protein [Salmonella enterica subsp. enterica serovar Newport]